MPGLGEMVKPLPWGGRESIPLISYGGLVYGTGMENGRACLYVQ